MLVCFPRNFVIELANVCTNAYDFTSSYNMIEKVSPNVIRLDQVSQPEVHLPPVDICLSEGVHLRLVMEDKNILAYCLFPNIYTYENQGILFSIIIICLLSNISMNNHDKIFWHNKF